MLPFEFTVVQCPHFSCSRVVFHFVMLCENRRGGYFVDEPYRTHGTVVRCSGVGEQEMKLSVHIMQTELLGKMNISQWCNSIK